MTKLVWGIDPLAAQRLGQNSVPSPLSVAELARLGIPARKIPRVQAELSRLAADGKIPAMALPALARQIARQLL